MLKIKELASKQGCRVSPNSSWALRKGKIGLEWGFGVRYTTFIQRKNRWKNHSCHCKSTNFQKLYIRAEGTGVKTIPENRISRM